MFNDLSSLVFLLYIALPAIVLGAGVIIKGPSLCRTIRRSASEIKQLSPTSMKKQFLFIIFLFACALNLYGASPIENLVVTEIPFVGERTSDVSIGESGRKLSIRYTNLATEVAISKNDQTEGVLKLHKDISIYCVRWFDGLPWFILRERVGPANGSLVVAIVEFKGLGNIPEFVYYTQAVTTQTASGRIFELSEVDKDKITVIASLHNAENKTISYPKGSILRSKLEEADINRFLIDDKLNAPSTTQEGEIMKRERRPAK